jgi:hypothetical protein
LKEILKSLILPLLFIWELPQNMLGLLVYAIMKMKRQIVITEQETHHLFIETPNTGVSLGWFIFWTPAGNRFTHLTNDCRMHEYGHARQSVMLGPLYLPVVGIPSLARVFYRRWYCMKYGHSWQNYFSAFPENWADKLGGVMDSKGGD